MKPIFCFFNFILAFAAIGSTPHSDQLLVGTACVDVSPTLFPIQLRSGKSSFVHDPLHVRAVAFEYGKGRAVICLIDAIGIGREMSDIAKSRAAEKTGWQTKDANLCNPYPLRSQRWNRYAWSRSLRKTQAR